MRPKKIDGGESGKRSVRNARKLSLVAILFLTVVLPLVLSIPRRTFALDTTIHISQYGHNLWRVQDGAFRGAPTAIAQTNDGYLWIGTDLGLVRFDGVRFVPWSPPPGQRLLDPRIFSLLAAPDGSLWIGTGYSISHWVRGELINYPALSGRIEAIAKDADGSVWLVRTQVTDGMGPVCRMESEQWRCYGKAEGIPFPMARQLSVGQAGEMWIGGYDQLLRWKLGGSSESYFAGRLQRAETFASLKAVATGRDGMVWLGRDRTTSFLQLDCFEKERWTTRAFPDIAVANSDLSTLFVDRDNVLWIGTANHGVFRVTGNTVDHYGHSDGLSSDAVMHFFQDREGTVWVLTSAGIDNFHDVKVISYTMREGLSAAGAGSVLATQDGTVWIGNFHSLDFMRGGKLSTIRSGNGLPGSYVTTFFQDHAGKLWVGIDNGLWVYDGQAFSPVRHADGSPLGIVFAITEDVRQNIWVRAGNYLDRITYTRLEEEVTSPQIATAYALAANPRGGILLGLVNGDLVEYGDGKSRTYASNEAGNTSQIRDLLVDADGSVWGTTVDELARWKDGVRKNLTTRNGLPCDGIFALVEDDRNWMWLDSKCGLVGIERSQLDYWWEHPDAVVKFELIDALDGVQAGLTPLKPQATRSRDGRLWFVNGRILQMMDRDHLRKNPVAPPVQIEEVLADREGHLPQAGLKLPSLTRNLEIDYTAPSYIAPQRVLFRYRLEGHDAGWQDAGTRRQAFYNDLRPAKYRFRVIACNSDGVWNEEGAVLDFVILPAWYQTIWFRAFCAAAFVWLLWGLYGLRIRQLQQEEAKFREAIESIPAMASLTSPEGKRLFVNRAWVDYTGLSVEQASGAGWLEAIHPDQRGRVVEKWETAMETGEAFEYEVRHRRAADGEYRWFLVRIVPVHDRHGKVVKWCGVATDIEDRKRAEQLQSDLAHTNRISLLGELAASISHELKQPIAATITNARTSLRWLRREQPEVQEACEAIGRIVQDGARATEIIDRLRSLYNKVPPQRELIDVNEIIGEMGTLLRSEASRYAVSIRTDLGTDLPKITADRVQVQQVLMNLMLNAIEAMKDTGGVLTIKSQPEDGHVVISVSDTGVGLPDGKTDEIFDAFFTTKPQGSGMGLAISRSIVESHGGRLWATPNDGRGASFHFTLPTGA